MFLSSCASSKKFSNEKESVKTSEGIFIPVRVLINENFGEYSFNVESPLKISNNDKVIALVKKGNRINLSRDGKGLILSIGRQSFSSAEFRISSAEETGLFSFGGKSYRGYILFSSKSKIVNVVSLEDYLKGVVPAEMPVGKDEENFEALKAFAICARTYTMVRLNENKPDFDLYLDTRDQVYGGANAENKISNKAIEETRGMFLEYNGNPATVFYHSSCGGFTEDREEMFMQMENSHI